MYLFPKEKRFTQQYVFYWWLVLVLVVPKEQGVDLQKALHEFHKRFYSAHLMTLAVQAPLPLEELERLVLSTFLAVPNNGLPPPARLPPSPPAFPSAPAPASSAAEGGDPVASALAAWHRRGDPFAFAGSAFAGRRYAVRGVKDVDRVVLTWSLPSLLAHYREKPVHVLSYLVGHEGPGSIIHSLRTRYHHIPLSLSHTHTPHPITRSHTYPHPTHPSPLNVLVSFA